MWRELRAFVCAGLAGRPADCTAARGSFTACVLHLLLSTLLCTVPFALHIRLSRTPPAPRSNVLLYAISHFSLLASFTLALSLLNSSFLGAFESPRMRDWHIVISTYTCLFYTEFLRYIDLTVLCLLMLFPFSDRIVTTHRRLQQGGKKEPPFYAAFVFFCSLVVSLVMMAPWALFSITY